MKSLGRLAALMVVLVMLLGVISCVTEEDDEKKAGIITWEMVARFIDQQLGEISDGTNATCNGQGLALGAGAHCKDLLLGFMIQAYVTQYVEISNDTLLFNGDSVFYKRGFMPRTMDPCVEDSNTNGIKDYTEVCITGQLVCTDLNNGHYIFDYQNCVWQEDGPDAWTLDGTLDIYISLTALSEQSLLQRTAGFTAANQTTNGTYSYVGDVLQYVLINPFIGGPALGTSGMGNDGMDIVSVTATVDMDGPGAAVSRTYGLYFASDYEDGLVFLNGRGYAVWLSNPGAAPLTFYQEGLPWDNVGTGCFVDVLALDAVNRTYNLSSQGAYGANGCLADANLVAY